MVEAYQRGLELYGQGRYQEAVGCFEACLRQNETSAVWNDWATAQFASGHVRQAWEGLKRALQLDPQNSLAMQNVRALVASHAAPQSCAGNQRQVKGMEQLVAECLEDIQRIPGENPSLNPVVIEAIRKMRISSAYYVEKCLERLARLPGTALLKALPALEKRAESDYRLSVVLGRCHMLAENFETAMRYLRSACDGSAYDLYAENTLIECSHRLAAKAGTSDEFEGLEAYLAESFCDTPWRRMEIYEGGNAALCCFGWVPLSAGDPRKQSLNDIWNSEFAVAIRRSILDGSFRFCSKIHCQHIAGRSLPRRVGLSATGAKVPPPEGSKGWIDVNAVDFPERLSRGPKTVRLCYEKSCNLACPQCRNDFFVTKREEQERMDREYLPFMLQAARDAEVFGLDGAGETFVSRHCRHLLSLIKRDEFPRLKFWFVSNGQLLNERAFREFDLYGRVGEIQISVDAARPETYQIVRRGGNFERLLANLAFLDELRSTRGEKFRFELCFVVSSLNFREMQEFVRLGRKFHVDSILFSIIRNWGHLSLEEFEKLNIANPSHPDHQELLKVLDSPELSDPIVQCGSMAPYRRSAA